MAEYVKFDHNDIQTIIGLLDETDDRNASEDIVLEKARRIAALQKSSVERETAQLIIDPETSRLTITQGQLQSSAVPYNGIARLSNLFAVTDYYASVFPANVLLKFIHVNPLERQNATTQSRRKAVLSGQELEKALRKS